ncbi:ATP-binding cassette sub-family G member 4-like [Dermatophagoides pteronyssinus]|uniref:ATP-binding cassette sub-family G member 4-like n=1 Tax=Dermatophagoides pteronyssinus TaxID=6956 RepID=UPI003F67000E
MATNNNKTDQDCRINLLDNDHHEDHSDHQLINNNNDNNNQQNACIIKFNSNQSTIPSSLSTTTTTIKSTAISTKIVDEKNLIISNNNDHHCKEDVRLVWHNLSYIIKEGGKFNCKRSIIKRPLIKNLNGSIHDGQLTAIIGPSGAGKTTLIECLAGRRIKGVKGEICVKYSGIPKSAIKISYYSQNDSLDELLTVEESLKYALRLRNCQRFGKYFGFGVDKNSDEFSKCCLLTCENSMDEDELHNSGKAQMMMMADTNIAKKMKKKDVNDLIIQRVVDELHLDKCLKNRVGRCSGGQKRRLSIALELLFSPKILLLDEPTSGLDSLSSLQCIQMLKKLVKNPRSPMMIATSIHQPTAKIMSYFDNLYIISYNGYCIYNGPTKDLVSKLSSFGLHCPQYHNPADFVIEVATGDFGQDVIMGMENHFRQICQDQTSERLDQNGDATMKSLSIHKLVQHTQKHSLLGQLLAIWVLLRRTLLISSRDFNIYYVRLTTILTILILIFILYRDNPIGQLDGCALRPTRDTVEKIQTFEMFKYENVYYANFGFIFFSVMLMVFVSILPTLLTFPLAVSVFMKENFNGWYSLKSYYIARNLADLPPMFFFPLLYGCLAYFITQQLFEWHRFLMFQAILIIVSILAQGLGFIVSAFFVKDVTTSTVVGGTLNIPLFLFTGLLIKISTMPTYFQPFTYLSYFRLGFEAILVTLYGLNRCEPVEPITYQYLKGEFGDNIIDMYVCLSDISPTAPENVTYMIDSYNEKFLTTLNTTSSSLALNAFDYNDHTLWFNLILMAIYLLLLRTFAYYILYRKTSIR